MVKINKYDIVLKMNNVVENVQNFETLMAEGVEAHAIGDHEAALKFRRNAFFAAVTELEQARALRDGAASHGYLDQLDQAKDASLLSVNLLQKNFPEEFREIGTSRDRYARVLSRIAIRQELDGSEPLRDSTSGIFAQAWGSFRKSERQANNRPYKSTPSPFSIDQYRINMAPRYAVHEALFGHSKLRAIGLGIRAVLLAPLSENLLLEHSSSEKLGAIHRGIGIPLKDVAVAGLALATVGLAPAKPKVSRRRTYALRLADKLMR